MKLITDKNISRALAIVVSASIVFSIVIFIRNSNIIEILNGTGDPSALSDKGDFLGGYLGTILSLLTVLLVYLTYNSQKEELKNQRDEFKLTRSIDLIYKETELINRKVNEYYKKAPGHFFYFDEYIKNRKKEIEDLKELDKKAKSFNKTQNDTYYNEIVDNALIVELSNSFSVLNYVLLNDNKNRDLKDLAVKKISSEVKTLVRCAQEYLEIFNIKYIEFEEFDYNLHGTFERHVKNIHKFFD